MTTNTNGQAIMNNYEKNALALNNAHDDTYRWAVCVGSDDARKSIDSHLLGGLMAVTDPRTFAALLARAEDFAGYPLRDEA